MISIEQGIHLPLLVFSVSKILFLNLFLLLFDYRLRKIYFMEFLQNYKVKY